MTNIRKIIRNVISEHMQYKTFGGQPKKLTNEPTDDFFMLGGDKHGNQFKELIKSKLTLGQVNDLAKEMGLRFVNDRNMIYKGYYADADGNAYFYGPIDILFSDVEKKSN